jgi:hypothetical protein
MTIVSRRLKSLLRDLDLCFLDVWLDGERVEIQRASLVRKHTSVLTSDEATLSLAMPL